MYHRVGWLEVVEHVSLDAAYELYRDFTGAKNVKDNVPIPDSDNDTLKPIRIHTPVGLYSLLFDA